MATGQSKIYLDIEARLRGNEDIKALNKTIRETEDAATGADSALVRAAKTLGVIPATRAQNRIDQLTKSFNELRDSGVLSAEQIDAAYERTLATINKISSAGAGDKFAASQGRLSPSEIKARGDLEIAEAKRVAAETKAIEQAAAADRVARQAELVGIQQQNAQRAAQMEIERRAKIESAANDRVLAIRERFDRVISSKSPEFQAGVRKEAMVSGADIKALKEYDAVLAKTGITARQTNAAMRMLPAQFSDIFVSLQGGQAPLTVFLQQGAQIKDSFGGVGNAVRALGGYILGLINPVNVAIAAFTAYAAIIYTVEKQQQALARAIAFSGNAIGLSTNQLNATAEAVAKSTNTTIGTVTELVGALAESGKISSESLAAITEAAVRTEKVGGMSLKEMTAIMVSLGKDPQKGLQELADKYGIVSLAIQEQVKGLIELGRQEEAIALVQKFAADEFNKRAKSVEDSTGSLIKAFQTVKKAAVEMWNSIFDLGRTDTEYQIKTTEARIASLTKLRDESEKSLLGNAAGGTSRYQAQIDLEQKSLDILKDKVAQSKLDAQATGESTRAAKEAAIAQEAVNKDIGDGAAKVSKLNKELTTYRANIEKVQAQRKKEGMAPLTAAEIAQGENAIRKRNMGQPVVNTYKPEALAGKQELMELQFLANERKRLYDQNLIDLDAYYKGQRQLLDAQAVVEQANYEAQKKRLQGEAGKFAGDPEKSKQLKDELAKLDMENFKFQGEQVGKIKALEDERLKTVRALRVELDGINKTYLDMIGQGTSAEAIELRRLEIAQKYAAIEDKINTALSQRNVVNGDELQRRKEQIAAIREQELAVANLAAKEKQLAVDLTANSVQQVQIQSQLQQGLISQVEATARLNELKREQLDAQIKIYEAEAASSNISSERLSQLTIKIAELKGQLEQTIPTVQAFGDQFKILFQDRVGAALGDVLTRTKSFKEAFKSLLAGIVQDIIRSNISKLIGQIFSAGFGGGATGNLPGVVAGGVAAATGGYISGPGTGTSDSIPARLSNGEFVIKAASVNKFGKSFFDMLNSGQMPAFANGGLVTRKPKVAPGFANGGQVTVASNDVTVNVINNSSQPVRARQEQDPRTGVVQVILEDLQRGGPISRNINAVTGTGRSVAR